MIFALLTGLVLGYFLAVPPGPVGVTAIKLSLSHGKKPATALALGNAVMDFTYCLIAVFAAKAILSLMDNFSTDHPVLMLMIQMAIVAGIFALGIVNVKHKDTTANPSEEKQSWFSRIYRNLSHRGPFLLGVGVAMTNIPNPTFFPTLVAATAFGLGAGFFENQLFNNLLFAVGFGFGNFLWLYTLSSIITRFKHKFSDNTIQKIHKFAGFTLIGFSTLLGYKILSITEWHAIFRLVFAF